LAGYVQRLQQFCPNYSGLTPAQTLALLSVTTPVNIASGIFSGFELAGRARLNPNFFLDYGYDVQSAVLNGVPDSFLKTNPTIVNGSQILGIPLNKATLGFAYSSHHGFDARFDTAFIGDNNGYNRPAYTYTNASVSQQLGRRTLLNLGVFNLFNQASDQYGRIGLGQFHPENQFGTDRNAFDQASERFGLPPTQVQLSVTQQI
ncbi:MAG: TonB-dependent receptor domain-containing protein, partial [Candidatus Dormibacteria bacterium]